MIYVNKEFVPEAGTSLREFISKCFDGYRFYATYHDPENVEMQCHRARRSFDDLLEISRTYFPETTEKELVDILFSPDMKMFIRFCPDIRKAVFEGQGYYGGGVRSMIDAFKYFCGSLMH